MSSTTPQGPLIQLSPISALGDTSFPIEARCSPTPSTRDRHLRSPSPISRGRSPVNTKHVTHQIAAASFIQQADHERLPPRPPRTLRPIGSTSAPPLPAQEPTPSSNSFPKTRSFIHALQVTTLTPSNWCESFFKPPFTQDRFLLKANVPQIHEGFAASLHDEALAWLEQHPGLNFPYKEFEDYYLIDPSFIPTQLEEQASIALEEMSDLSSTLEEGLKPQQLTLGRRPLEIDQEALESAFNLFQDNQIEDFEAFVQLFNTHRGQVDSLRLIAFYHIETLTRNVQPVQAIPESLNDSNFTSARLGLVTLAKCTCPQVQRAALERLIDILNADPISQESFNYLPELIEHLVKLIQFEHSKNFDIRILRLMIQAFATSIMTLWLHTETTHNASIMPSSLRHKIWEQADGFSKQLTHTPTSALARGQQHTTDIMDESVLFWVEFAIQAAQRLSTEVSARAIRKQRVVNFCKGILQLARMVGNLGSKALGGPDIGEAPSAEGVDLAISHLKEAFYHMENREEWYEQTLAFHYLALLVRYFPEYLDELDAMAFRYKAEQGNVRLFFGMISSLEHLLLHTTNANIAERCYKILMANLFCNEQIIKQRTIQALLRIKSQGNNCLSITARCLLVLIWETMTPLQELINLNEISDGLIQLFNDLSESERQLSLHCIALFIRRILTIQSESGLSQESLIGLVTRAQTDDPDGDGTSRSLDVLQALKTILSNPLTPDSEGNSILHACVMRCNRKLISIASKVFPEILKPDAVNFAGKTALMLCVDPMLPPPFLEGIPELAPLCNPNLRDLLGYTFVHYLVQNATPADIEHILTKLNWKQRIDLNIRNRDGLTPIMLCLAGTPSPAMISNAKMLIKISADSLTHATIVPVDLHLPDRDGQSGLAKVIATGDIDLLKMVPVTTLERAPEANSAIMLAAKANQPEMLQCIIAKLTNHRFTKVEIFCLFRCALIQYGTGSATNDKLMKTIIEGYDSNRQFQQGCQEALPKLTWKEASTGEITFFCEGEPLEVAILKNAALGTEHGEQASKLFDLNFLMNASLKDSEISLHEIERKIQETPALLEQQNVLGRTALLMALLGGRPEVLTLLLTYKRQNFHVTDFAGHGAMHYAVATLNVRAVRILFELNVSAHQVNALGLIPMVLALAHIPSDMLPTPISTTHPYYRRFQSVSQRDPYLEHHEHFCEILDLMLENFRKELTDFRSPYGWNLAHWAAVYGHRLQAYAIIQRLPNLLFAKHRQGGRTPVEQAIFHGRPDIALAFIDGWISSATSCGINDPIKTLQQNFGEKGLSLSTILAELGAIDHLRDLYNQTCSPPSHMTLARTTTMSDALAYLPQMSHEIHRPSIVSAHRAFLKPSTHQNNDRLPDLVTLAIQKGQSEVLELFTTNESDIRQLLFGTDSNGYTAIMLASKYRQIACLEKLLALAQMHGHTQAVLDARNNFGQNAVHILCSLSRSQAVDELMTLNPDLNGLKEATSLLDTQLKRCLEIIFNIYSESVLNSKDESGQNVAHAICFFNHSQLLLHLINLVEAKYSNSACRSPGKIDNRSPRVKQLERLLGGVNDDRRPPVFMAVAAASESCLDILHQTSRTYNISIGLETRDIFGISCLAVAAQEGHLNICSKLLVMQVDPYAVDALGHTVLHLAASNHQWAVVEYLVSKCPELVMKRNQLGRSALQSALSNPIIGKYTGRRRFFCAFSTFPVSSQFTTTQSLSPMQGSPVFPMAIPPGDRNFLQGFELRSSVQIPKAALATVQAYLENSVSQSPSRTKQDEVCYNLADAASRISPQLLEPDTLDPKKADALLAIMNLLLDRGLSLEQQDHEGWSSWHLICRGPYAILLSHALAYAQQRKAVPDFAKLRTTSGLTVFHICAQFGQLGQLNLLRPYAKAINVKTNGRFALMTREVVGDNEGLTAPAVAIRQSRWDIFDWCLSVNCKRLLTTRNEDREGHKGSNYLHLVAESTQSPLNQEAVDIFQKLAKEHPILLMEPNAKGQLPLETAVDHLHPELIPLILSIMKPGEKADESLKRAIILARQKSEAGERASSFQNLAYILEAPCLKEIVGAAWTGLTRFAKINDDYQPPSMEALAKKATAQYQLSYAPIRSPLSSHRRSTMPSTAISLQ